MLSRESQVQNVGAELTEFIVALYIWICIFRHDYRFGLCENPNELGIRLDCTLTDFLDPWTNVRCHVSTCRPGCQNAMQLCCLFGR